MCISLRFDLAFAEFLEDIKYKEQLAGRSPSSFSTESQEYEDMLRTVVPSQASSYEIANSNDDSGTGNSTQTPEDIARYGYS